MPDRASWKVRGPVEWLRMESAEWDLAKQDWNASRSFSLTRFGPDGKITETEYHNPDGSISATRNVYDERGRLRESRTLSNDTLTWKSIWFYDAYGRPIRLVDVDLDGVERDSQLYSYDANGRQTRIVFVPKGEPGTSIGIDYSIESTGSFYGAAGAATVTTLVDEVLFHDVNHRLLQRLVITRDSVGRIAREDVRPVGGKPFPDISTELEKASPERRQAIAEMFQKIFGAGPTVSTTYAYDQKGRRIARQMRMGDLGGHLITSRYDDHDNPIEETTVNTSREMGVDRDGNLRTNSESSNTQVTRFEYTYDAQENWTERVVWSRLEPNPNFERSNVERRQLTYYRGGQ
jgi:hypothetical protein